MTSHHSPEIVVPPLYSNGGGGGSGSRSSGSLASRPLLNRGKAEPPTYATPSASSLKAADAAAMDKCSVNGKGAGHMPAHANKFLNLLPSLPAVQYTAAASSSKSTFLLRSDGFVDTPRWCGRMRTLRPAAPGTTYTAVSAAGKVAYFLRSDGKVDRKRRCRKLTSLAAPLGAVYTAVSAGPHSSYLLRSDGKVDRVMWGKVTRTLAPPAGVAFISVSAGKGTSHLVRSDGAVECVTWGCGGRAHRKVRTSPEGYAAVSTRRAARCYSRPRPNLLITGSGHVDIVQRNGNVTHSIAPPNGLAYVAADGASLLRDDGAVDVADKHFTEARKTLTPPAGLEFVGVSGKHLVRSDGAVQTTNCRGNLSSKILVARPLAALRCARRGRQCARTGRCRRSAAESTA